LTAAVIRISGNGETPASSDVTVPHAEPDDDAHGCGAHVPHGSEAGWTMMVGDVGATVVVV